ncbi:hypothetical protein Ancab_012563 [Ancistrocladus abbreviatus]
MGVSSNCLICMNCIGLCLSPSFILAAHMFKLKANSPCDPVAGYKPLIVVGVSLFVICLFGLLGSCCGCKCFLCLYLMILLVMIACVVYTMLLGEFLMKGYAGEQTDGTGKEYHLSEFSSWLTDAVLRYWLPVKKCMVKHNACRKFQSYRSFNQSNTSPMGIGCCKPPSHCGFKYEGPNNWKAPEKGITSSDPDCKAWSNQKQELCYDCNSCKAAYLATMTKSLKDFVAVDFVLLGLLIIIFVLGCCACCN